MRALYAAVAVALLAGGGFFALKHAPIAGHSGTGTASSTISGALPVSPGGFIHDRGATSTVAAHTTTQISTPTPDATSPSIATDTLDDNQKVLSQSDLLALADTKYADGSLPLGDYKYVTDAPKKGYIYLCNVHKDNPGSMVNGSWMHGDTWNYLQKISISGSVSWPNATFANTISGSLRVLEGNGLPVGYTTGIFPVQSSDPAAQYDPNPNTISSQSIRQQLSANPTYSDTPSCMGGEVGIMTDGVPLFNGFDAGLRDAAAHELQDSCDGHPQGSGEYHYHSLSACFKDIKETTVLGYAFDGFPITGPQVTASTYLTTEDLDECHGITSEIIVDGKKKVTYHYVMTRDFPYSVSCFRGKPVTLMAIAGGQQQTQSVSGGQSSQGTTQQGGTPPQAAISACSGKSSGSSCSFTAPQGTISGTCGAPPNMTLACHP